MDEWTNGRILKKAWKIEDKGDTGRKPRQGLPLNSRGVHPVE
jgi:hypothetical protein